MKQHAVVNGRVLCNKSLDADKHIPNQTVTCKHCRRELRKGCQTSLHLTYEVEV